MNLLSVKNVEKYYRKYPAGIYHFLQCFGIQNVPYEETLILRDINFTVEKGENIAIIGKNGAGKSTLLKMISGVIPISRGEIISHCQTASIFNLGAGINPFMTGRQNTRFVLNLLGFNSEKNDPHIEAVKEFSELGKYFEYPARTYSTGMIVRLAFSIMTEHLPKILIVDEALSVGDFEFAMKCQKRINSLRSRGVSLLITTHDQNILSSLCDRALLIHQQHIVMDDKPEKVLGEYARL